MSELPSRYFEGGCANSKRLRQRKQLQDSPDELLRTVRTASKGPPLGITTNQEAHRHLRKQLQWLPSVQLPKLSADTQGHLVNCHQQRKQLQ